MLPRLLSLGLTVLATGCVGERFRENIRESYGSVRDEQREIARLRDAGAEPLSWKRAAALLEQRNVTYRRSQLRLDEIRGEQKHFVWRQLNPRLLAVANLSTTIGTFSSVVDDGLGMSMLGSVNLPDPASIYGLRYALELSYYQALLDHELLERRLHASLYGYFLQQKEIDQLNSRPPLEGDMEDVARAIERRANSFREEDFRKSQQLSVRLNVNKLLDTPGANWELLPETLPRISYEGRLGKLNPERGYARLAMWQMAGQVELSRARLTQLKISQLPLLSNGVTIPSLYNSERSSDFDIEDVGLFASLSRSIEFTGRRQRSLKQAEEQSKYTKRILSQRLESELAILDRSKEQYRLLGVEKAYLEKQLKWLKSNPPEARSQQVLTHVSEMRELDDRLREVVLRQRRSDLQFWIWDDSYWGSPFGG